MEKIILKTIREAFNIAYINKLIKESSEEMAKKLTPDQLRVAENMYNRWTNGRLNLELGKQDEHVLNYVIEKAAEEYKQTKDSRLRDAIASIFYPNSANGGNKVYKILINYKPFLQNIKKRFGEKGWRNVAEDAIGNAFVKVVMDPTNFEKIIDSYKGDVAGSGIIPLFVHHLQNGLAGISSQLASPKRGGSAGITSYDDPESFVSGKVSGEEDDKISTAGSDLAVDTEFSGVDSPEAMVSQIADDLNYDNSKGDLIYNLGDLFNDFADGVEEISKNPKIKTAPGVSYALIKYFRDKVPYEEIMASKPELYQGKSPSQFSTDIVNNLKSGKFALLAQQLGPKYNLPTNWLDDLLKNKALKDIQKALGKKEEKVAADDEYTKPTQQSWSPLFEKKIEENMDAIIKEVYKRLEKTNK